MKNESIPIPILLLTPGIYSTDLFCRILYLEGRKETDANCRAVEG